MKNLTILLLFLSGVVLATETRLPGSGSNPSVGPGPTTDSGSSTSIMGGGTPGGNDTYGSKDPKRIDEEIMQKQEEDKSDKGKKKTDGEQSQ